MLFKTAILSMVAAVSATTLSYDQGYDDASRSLDVVSCSDGANGLITRYSWKQQGDIPRFPYIGGSETIAAWNSPNCGLCWELTYENTSIYVLAIDHAASGLNIGLTAMNALTGNRAVDLGRVDVTAVQTAASNCGL